MCSRSDACTARAASVALRLLVVAVLAAHTATAQRSQPPAADDGKMRRVSLALTPGAPCTKQEAGAVQVWLRRLGGVRRASAKCNRRSQQLEIAAACRRGAASECTEAMNDVQALQQGTGGTPGNLCADVAGLCDSVYAASGFKNCIAGDTRCSISSDMMYATPFFPPPKRTGDLRASYESCGGVERFKNGGALMSSIQFRQLWNVDDSKSVARRVAGFLCTFDDKTTKMVGTWNSCQDKGRYRNYTGVGTAVQDKYTVNLGTKKLRNVTAYYDPTVSNTFCAMAIITDDGKTTAPQPELAQGCFGTTPNGVFGNMVPDLGASSRVIDLIGALDADGCLTYISMLVMLRADSMEIKRLEYQDLVMQSGPLPSYSFGVLLDAAKSSVGGDVSTTIAFTTSQKTALTSSTTSGKEISASLGVTLKTDILPIPEYSVEGKWAKSSSTISSETETKETTIKTTPKLLIQPYMTGAMYSMMYNGTCALPWKGFAELQDKGNRVVDIVLNGVLQMEGSLDVYTSANASTNDIPGINPNGTDDDFVPTPATRTLGYPLSWPLAYSANVSIGRATTPPPEDIIWCGDAMPHGGIRTITIRYVDWATDEYLLNWMELTMADGTKSCGEFGSYTYPETGNPPTKTHNLTMTLRGGERFTGMTYYVYRGFGGGEAYVYKGLTWTTNFGKVYEIGGPKRGLTAIPVPISTVNLGSGVLDGFGLKTMISPYGIKVPLLAAITPVFLQPFTSTGVEVTKIASPPVDLPTNAARFQISGINTQNIELTTSSMLQYDLGSTLKDSWSFSQQLKIDKYVVPVIPIQINAAMKWTDSNEYQKSDTRTWSQKSTTTVSLNLNYGSTPSKGSAVYVKVHDRAANIPYNGCINVTFGSGFSKSWNFTSSMQATDGSFSILDIADTIKGADDNTTSLIAISATSVSPAAAAVAKLGIPEAASLQSMEALASLLLALPNSDHRKHRALAMYDVKANETTWEAVCEAAICDPALAIALNPNTTLVAEARVVVPTIG